MGYNHSQAGSRPVSHVSDLLLQPPGFCFLRSLDFFDFFFFCVHYEYRER